MRLRIMIGKNLLIDIRLLMRARLVHPWHLSAPTWIPPPVITCRREPLFSLFYYFVSCACAYPEHGTATGEPGAVAGVRGRWWVERGLEGARSPFLWLGVAFSSRNDGSMNGFSLASWCGVGCNTYKSIRVVLVCKKYLSGAYFRDHAEFHRGSFAV